MIIKTSNQIPHIPTVIAQTDRLSESEWLKYRQQGIGGSDAAAVLGLSPFCTTRDLYYEKTGIKSAVGNEQNHVAKQVGHLLEPIVGEIFSRKTNLKIIRDNTMYSHPGYPFMIANIDYFVEMPDGTRAILECKTANYNTQDKWADGAVPINYELQVRHYMAVMNIDTAFCACLFGNNENEFAYRRIYRDFDYEYDIIEQEKHFWEEHIQKRVEPPYTESGDLVIESLRKHYGGADKSVPAVSLDGNLSGTIEKYFDLRSQKLELNRQADDIDDEMKRLSAKVIDFMGTGCNAVCKSGPNEYYISYKPSYRENISKDGIDALRTFHPDIYDNFVTKTESRRFTVTRKELGA
ncbi:MAG: YqaJ viral recombinase family protein [Oscillospiraceae bacterium]|nr:YqaJ viral recombinase family protein [Oscillospiraceae bacterium]